MSSSSRTPDRALLAAGRPNMIQKPSPEHRKLGKIQLSDRQRTMLLQARQHRSKQGTGSDGPSGLPHSSLSQRLSSVPSSSSTAPPMIPRPRTGSSRSLMVRMRRSPTNGDDDGASVSSKNSVSSSSSNWSSRGGSMLGRPFRAWKQSPRSRSSNHSSNDEGNSSSPEISQSGSREENIAPPDHIPSPSTTSPGGNNLSAFGTRNGVNRNIQNNDRSSVRDTISGSYERKPEKTHKKGISSSGSVGSRTSLHSFRSSHRRHRDSKQKQALDLPPLTIQISSSKEKKMKSSTKKNSSKPSESVDADNGSGASSAFPSSSKLSPSTETSAKKLMSVSTTASSLLDAGVYRDLLKSSASVTLSSTAANKNAPSSKLMKSVLKRSIFKRNRRESEYSSTYAKIEESSPDSPTLSAVPDHIAEQISRAFRSPPPQSESNINASDNNLIGSLTAENLAKVTSGPTSTPIKYSNMHQEKQSAEPKKVEVLMSVNINSSELHDDGYSSFLQELKNETASDHTELWKAFQTTMGRTESQLHPIQLKYESLSDNEPPTAGGPRKKKKLNPEAQQMLSSIHQNLMSNARKSDCAYAPQLVSDKKVAKERNINKQKSQHVNKLPKVVEEMPEKEQVGQEDIGHKNQDTPIHTLPNVSAGQTKCEKRENQTTCVVEQNAEESHLTKPQAPKTAPSSASSMEKFPTIPSRLVRQKSWLTTKRAKSTQEEHHTDEKITVDAPFGTPVRIKKTRVVEPIEGRKTSEKVAGSSSPWSVKLKPVNAVSKQIESTSSRTEVSSSSLFQIKLKPVPPPEPSPAKPIFNQRTSLCDKIPFAITVGDLINLSKLPERAFDSQQEAEIIRIEDSSEDHTPEQHKFVIVVGKQVILTARLLNEAHSSEKRAIVVWSSRRQDIRSLTLDIEATGAALALTDKSTFPISFGSPDDCLKFAQAFYKYKTTTPAKPPRPSKVPETITEEEVVEESPQKVEKSIGADTKVEMPENITLSGEEEKLLRRYRQMLESETPVAAIKETMATENVEDRLINILLSPKASNDSKLPDQAKIESEDEKKLTKFRMMLKMQIPPDAVKHKMTLENIDKRLIDELFPPQTTQTGDQNHVFDEGEQKLVSKFSTMIKMGVPPEGVRHKMMRENIDKRIVDAVLQSDSNKLKERTPKPLISSELSEKEEEIASKYRKMLKMRIPSDAVRHKMTKEKIDNKIIDAVLGKESDESVEVVLEPTFKTSKQVTSTLSDDEEIIASKYRKMLKMFIPPDAVRHKMKQEQISQNIVQAVLGPSPTDPPPECSPPLSLKDEKIVKEYRSMLKMGVPAGGVRHKMMKDGIDSKLIDIVFEEKEKSSTTPERSQRKKTKTSASSRKSTLVALHWTPLSGKDIERSIWGKSGKKRKTMTTEPVESDLSKLEELFQKKSNTRVPKAASKRVAESGKEMAKLVDLTRANNVAISLLAFKDFSHDELAATIKDLDPDCKIRGERVQFIQNLLPSQIEANAVKSYTGDDSKLVPAEIFFRRLQHVEHVENKVRIMQTMDSFHDNVNEIAIKFQTLSTVCNKVVESEHLQLVLETVLNIGNIMNEGTRTGGAEGFKFDSLLKLTQTKSADGKMTVLDYIVMTFVAKNERSVLALSSEFPDCSAASRMAVSDMVNDVRSLRMGLDRCKTELINMKNEQSDKRVTRSMKSQFGSTEKSSSSTSLANSNPRSAMLSAIASRQTEDVVLVTKDMESSLGNRSQSFSPGVVRLETFLKEASIKLTKLESERDCAIESCQNLSLYCGEGGEERGAAPVLSVLSEFVANLDNAVESHDVRVGVEAKKAAREKKRQEEERKKKKEIAKKKKHEVKKKRDITKKKPGRESLVLMVNDMLKTVSPKKREEFTKGVTYQNPEDKRLKKIYEEETSRKKVSGGLKTSKKMEDPRANLMMAIKSRGSSSKRPSSMMNVIDGPCRTGTENGKDQQGENEDPRATMLKAIQCRRSHVKEKSQEGDGTITSQRSENTHNPIQSRKAKVEAPYDEKPTNATVSARSLGTGDIPLYF